MNQPSANPYAPPIATDSAFAASPRAHQLLPLWIWLGVAVCTSILGTPADPLSMLMALAYGLVSFWVGAILGSSLQPFVRMSLTVLLCIPAIALVFLSNSYFVVVVLCYLLASIVFGFWASRRIDSGRFHVVLCFSAGYVLGSTIGASGTVVGAVVGAILAKRSLPIPDSR